MPWVVDQELTILSLDVKPNLCELEKPFEVDISYKLFNCPVLGATWKVQVPYLMQCVCVSLWLAGCLVLLLASLTCLCIGRLYLMQRTRSVPSVSGRVSELLHLCINSCLNFFWTDIAEAHVAQSDMAVHLKVSKNCSTDYPQVYHHIKHQRIHLTRAMSTCPK